MINLAQELEGVCSVAIAGHIRPDGDAVGSCLGLYLYLKENFPDKKAVVYLEKLPAAYEVMNGTEEICHDFEHADEPVDLFFSLDCADTDRLGNAQKILKNAKRTICIDHHISNVGFADVNYIVPDASSTSELVCNILEDARLPQDAAAALYMGIAHDTGVFRHSCTSPETMETAARLMRHGIDCSKIISRTYYDKTYHQNQILGKALQESMLLLDGRVIFSVVRLKDMEFYGVTSSDLDGIVQQLMGTIGAEAAIFLYETSPNEYKVSMRSKEIINVSEIAGYFGGGGHVRAAGCNMQGSVQDVVNNITLHMEKQLKQAEQ